MPKPTTTPVSYYQLRAAEMFHIAYGQVTDEQILTARDIILCYSLGWRDAETLKFILDCSIKILN